MECEKSRYGWCFNCLEKRTHVEVAFHQSEDSEYTLTVEDVKILKSCTTHGLLASIDKVYAKRPLNFITL